MTSRISLEEIAVRHSAVGTSSRQLSGRPSLIFSWHNEQGEHLGEACPLEGFGADSLDVARSELLAVSIAELEEAHSTVCDAFQNTLSVELDDEEGGTSSEQMLFSGPRHPVSTLEAHSARFLSASARHCFETVVMGAAAGSCGVPAVRLLAASPVVQVFKTSAVLDPFASNLVAQVTQSHRRGIFTIKLKCGRDLAREGEALARLTASSHALPGLRLRLDANQGFRPQDCLQLIEAARGLRIDWIEDPTAELADWNAITGATLAVDEPLLQIAPSEVHELPAEVIVLKPMALGGWSRCLRFAVAARAHKKKVSLSHFFDGPIAMDAAISLAFALQSPEFAPGLGRHVALSQHLPRSPQGFHGEELRIVEARA